MSKKSRANKANAEVLEVEVPAAPTKVAKKGKEKVKAVAKEVKIKEPVIGGKTVRKNGKLSARGLPCLCGCGQPTTTTEARFISGHDAKLRKALLAGEDCPDVARPFFEAGETLGGVGMEGGEFVDLKPTA